MNHHIFDIADMNAKKPDGLAKDGRPIKVMVVDDSLSMRKIISQILKSELYEICAEASNGEEALNKYKECKPDLVTLDINMPKRDGISALKEILHYDENAQVVMATSEGFKETVLKAISLGAKGYIVKPPDRDTFLEKIRSVVREGR